MRIDWATLKEAYSKPRPKCQRQRRREQRDNLLAHAPVPLAAPPPAEAPGAAEEDHVEQDLHLVQAPIVGEAAPVFLNKRRRVSRDDPLFARQIFGSPSRRRRRVLRRHRQYQDEPEPVGAAEPEDQEFDLFGEPLLDPVHNVEGDFGADDPLAQMLEEVIDDPRPFTLPIIDFTRV